MTAEQFVKIHHPNAFSNQVSLKKSPVLIFSIDDGGRQIYLGKGETKAKAWINAKNTIKANEFAVTATNPNYKRLEQALAKAAKSMGWKGLTAHLAVWCKKNQPNDTNYSLPWWCREIKYTEKKNP